MHILLRDNPGEQMLLLGNEAIARGALEAGVAFAAAYPGTPSSEIAWQIFRQTDLYFEYSANEKVSLEIAAGAAMCGLKTMATMKHVGVNVAADALMTLAYTGIKGALAGSKILPIELKTFRNIIRTKTKPQFTEVNLIAFDLGTFAVNFSSTH